MDVRPREIGKSFKFKRKARVVWLSKHHVHIIRVAKPVHDKSGEVALEAAGLCHVDAEVGLCERAVLDAAAASVTHGIEVEDVVFRCDLDKGAVASEAYGGRKDVCLKDGGGMVVGQRRIARPVPVSVRPLS